MRQLGKIFCIEHNEVENGPWVILFHGYGADAHDLSQLSELVPTQQTWNWLFPNGTLEVPIGPGWTGRAWWHIDMAAINEAAQRGTTRDMTLEDPPGLKKATELVNTMINQMKIPRSQIVIGGFSQGAMLATEVFLTSAEPFAGLISLSGTLLKKDQWKALAGEKKGSSVFLSHGQSDQILGFKYSEQLMTLFAQNEMKCKWVPFRGGHEIPLPVLNELGQFLNQLNVK